MTTDNEKGGTVQDCPDCWKLNRFCPAHEPSAPVESNQCCIDDVAHASHEPEDGMALYLKCEKHKRREKLAEDYYPVAPVESDARIVYIPPQDEAPIGPMCGAEFTSEKIEYAPPPNPDGGDIFCTESQGHAGAHFDDSMAGRIAWMTLAEADEADRIRAAASKGGSK